MDDFVIFAFFLGFLTGIVGAIANYFLLKYLSKTQYSKKGGEKAAVSKLEEKEELEEALAEAAQEFAAGKNPQEILKTVALKHPKLAFKLAKQLGIGI